MSIECWHLQTCTVAVPPPVARDSPWPRSGTALPIRAQLTDATMTLIANGAHKGTPPQAAVPRGETKWKRTAPRTLPARA